MRGLEESLMHVDLNARLCYNYVSGSVYVIHNLLSEEAWD